MTRRRTNLEDDRLPAPPRRGERRPGLRPIAGAASRIVGPIVAQRGGGVLVRLKSQWAAVVGDELAARTWPEALDRDGALKLRVVPGFAVDLQHRSPLVIERINGFFGRVAATRLVLRQGPLPLTAGRPSTASARLTAAQQQAIEARLATIAAPELRAALAGLAQHVLAEPHRDD